MSTKLAHRDPKLNILRLVAFGVMGYYVYKVHQKQGSLSGVHAGGQKIRLNPEAIVDTVMPFVPMEGEGRDMLAIAGKNLLRGYLKEKGLA